MLKVLSDMPDDQREKVVSSAMMLNIGKAGGNDPTAMSFMWPILANIVKQNPAVPQPDIMKMAATVNQTLVEGFNMGRTIQGNATSGVSDMFKMFDFMGSF